MREWMKTRSWTPFYEEVKLVPYLHSTAGDLDLYVLGKYEVGETFAGTDRLSMAVQPHALKFLQFLSQRSNDGFDQPVALFEGDRLFTSSFLEDCANLGQLNILALNVKKPIRQARFAERGSNQDETWLRGRESKVNNIYSNMLLQPYITHITNDEREDLARNVKLINTIVGE